jgi:hypothetical protein
VRDPAGPEGKRPLTFPRYRRADAGEPRSGRRRGPKLVALSSHDSTPWTYDLFARRLGGRYRTLHAGEELRITAASAG